MAFLNFFFGPKKSSCCTKNPIIDPIFLLDYYFSVLKETKSPLNGFLSTQIKKLWVKTVLILSIHVFTACCACMN